MGTIINLTNALSSFWLAICALLFYIILYGNDSSMVQRWKFLQHWSLKVGLIGIIVGSVMNALEWRSSGWQGALMNVGLALVFNWAYLYHKNIFVEEKKAAKMKQGIVQEANQGSAL